RSRRGSYPACAAVVSPPMRRGRRAARRRCRAGARPSRPPPTSTTSTNLHNLRVQRVPGPGGPVVSPFQRRDVQRDRRQVVEQDRPRGEGAHRRDTLYVPLAGVADLDFARLLTCLRREVAELVVLGFVTEHATQERDRPSRPATPAAQATLPLEPGVLRHDRPRATKGAVALPPRGRQLARPPAGTRLEQGQGRHLTEDAGGVRLPACRRGP